MQTAGYFRDDKDAMTMAVWVGQRRHCSLTRTAHPYTRCHWKVSEQQESHYTSPIVRDTACVQYGNDEDENLKRLAVDDEGRFRATTQEWVQMNHTAYSLTPNIRIYVNTLVSNNGTDM
jgi:hypothetical protein